MACYFDNAASSLHTRACKQAMDAFDAQPWAGANPNSLHASGRAAFAALQDARRRLARAIGAQRPGEITFTSGGTESNNLAIRGIARAALNKSHGKRHRVLVSAIEHDSVLEQRVRLHDEGIALETIPVTTQGVVDERALESMLADDVALVSVMTVNNELGTIQPVQRIAELAHAHGALVHTDAVQALGKIPFDVRALGVDAASITAHKLGGLVGVGALYTRARTPIEPCQFGGGQEAGLRSGTVDVRGAVVFAAVAEDGVSGMGMRTPKLEAIAQEILSGLVTCADPVARMAVPLWGDAPFAPGIVCLVIPGHDSQSLVLALDDLGYETAGGSACSSGSLEPSHVLRALGVPRDLALCELRLSFDDRISLEDASGLVAAIRSLCEKKG